MKRWGLHSFALVAAAGLLGFLFFPIVADWVTFDLSTIDPNSVQPGLVRNGPAFGLEAQQQQLGETLTKLGEQQARLTQDLTALDAKLTRLETQLNGLTLSTGKEINQAEQHIQVKQMISELTVRLTFLETELESEVDNGFMESNAIQAQVTGQIEDIESLRITELIALDAVFDAEPRSDAWATRKEAELSQLLLSNERTQDGQLFDYECRSTMCRLSMQFDSIEARNQSLETIPALLDLDSEVSALPTEGTTDVTIYVMN